VWRGGSVAWFGPFRPEGRRFKGPMYISVLLENIGGQTATRIHDKNLNTR